MRSYRKKEKFRKHFNEDKKRSKKRKLRIDKLYTNIVQKWFETSPRNPLSRLFHRHNAREIYRGHRSLPVLSHCMRLCVWKTLTSLTSVALVSKASWQPAKYHRERIIPSSPSTLFIKMDIPRFLLLNDSFESSSFDSRRFHIFEKKKKKKREDGINNNNNNKRETKISFACHRVQPVWASLHEIMREE